MRKLRVVCSDPDATDCSSDEDDQRSDNNKPGPLKRIVHQIDLAVVIPCEVTDQNSPKKRRRDLRQTLKSPFKGVRQRRSGKWASEIRDPVNRVRIWLGTFVSAEEAYEVYLAKKLELEAKSMAVSKQKDEPNLSPSVLENECSASPTDGSSDISNSAVEDCGDELNGLTLKQFSQNSGGHELNLGLEIGSLIIDNYGNLLGEFSRLDDLRICDIQEDDSC